MLKRRNSAYIDLSGTYVQHQGPPYHGNPFSLLTFWPAGKLIEKGAKGKLQYFDSFRLDKDDTASKTTIRLEERWKKEKIKKKPSLLTTVFKTFSKLFIQALLLQSIYAIFSFTTPILLPFVISFLEFDGKRVKDGFVTNEIPIWHGIVYLIAIVFATLAGTLTLFHSQFLTWKLGLRLRSSLIMMVYKKSLTISPSENVEGGQVVNMISTDSQLFLDSVIYFSQGFIAPLQIIVTTVLLWLQIKYYSLIPIGFFILSLPINTFITRSISKFRKKLQRYSDIRIKLISEMIDAIKTIKFFAWEKPFLKKIRESRKVEVKQIRSLLLWRSFMQFLMLNVPTIGLGVTFIVYSLSNDLTTTIVFTTISLMQLLRSSFVAFPVAVTFYGQYKVAFERIQEYIMKRDIKPQKIKKNMKDYVISIKDANVSWDNENFALKDINLNISKGELVMVVGSVGSGKSTLGKLIIGETNLTSGSVKVSDYIAYASQDPYIVNGTIRENILFGNPYIKEIYDKVIEVCGLTLDLTSFEDGDLTEIGEKGANLSGGQRQRISLARAVYSRRNILVLDDPLSALDSQVSEFVFRRVIMDSYYQGKTIILITNDLNHLQKASKIVFMKNNRIEDVGDLKTIMESNRSFKELVLEYSVMEDEETNNNNNNNNEKRITRRDSILFNRYLEQTYSSKEVKTETRKKLVDEEEKDSGSITLKHYLNYFKSGSLFRFIIYIIAVTFRSGARLGGTIWLATWSSDDPNNPKYSKNVYLYVYLAFVIGEALFTWLYSSLLVFFSTNASRTLHVKLLNSVIAAKTTFFDITPVGRLLNRFSKDISLIDIPLPNNLEHLNSNIFTLLGIVIGIGVGNPYALISVIISLIFYFLLSNYYRKASIQVQRQEAISRSPVFSHISETLSGVENIRCYHKQKSFTVAMESKLDANTADYLSLKTCAMWFGMRLDWLGLIIIATTYIAVIITRSLTIVDVALASLALSNTTGISSYLASSSALIAEVDTKLNAVERVKQYFQLESEDSSGTKPIQPWPRRGSIKIHQLTVEYKPGQPVINDLSLKIRSGEKLGIVGRTGAGKSTLLTSLFRSVEATKGYITIDDIDISKVPLHILRSSITYIPQVPSLFSGTIRFNLDPLGQYGDNEIWDALDKVELKEYVSSLPKGLYEIVEEKGQNFSIGQKKLFSIARAILQKNKIIVIDEATASVDLETNSSIQKMIRKCFADNTIITIAHMLHTIMDNDRVLVMEKGRAVETDTPYNLLNKKVGKFKQMVNATGVRNSVRLRRIAIEKRSMDLSRSEQRKRKKKR